MLPHQNWTPRRSTAPPTIKDGAHGPQSTIACAMTTTTMKDDIYAFIFGQKGLMAGLGIQGNKISKTNPK